MIKLQEKLDFLLDKYQVETKAVIKDLNTVTIDGKDISLLSHRYQRQFIELKNIALGGTLVGISVMRVARIIEKGEDLYKALYRELDLCQWILNDEIKQITVMENGNVLNAIATTKSDIVCTIEVSATLKKGERPIEKHEIISERGIACDVVVDAQLKQDSIYVYGTENKKYTDVDFELYGLSIEEIAVVRSAFALAQKKNYDENIAADKQLNNLVQAAEKSAKNCERVVL
ncbi:MAG: hypothetical protein J6A69_02605 [Clostridia bacterium]|nr:hypothetical protein [Clostridia bacterium]